MEELQYCRACLVTGVKMYNLASTAGIFSQLTQVTVYDEAKQHICFECACLLRKFNDFKSKCLRAHNILMTFQENASEITTHVQNIDRKQNKLATNLLSTAVLCVSCETSNEPPIDYTVSRIADSDVDNISDFNDYQDDDITCSSEESIPAKESHLKKKTKNVKEVKTRKRTAKMVNIMNEKEPLSKAKRKLHVFRKHSILHTDYFNDFATIKLLTPDEARKEVLLRKETSNYKKSPFQCNLCYRGYGSKSSFDNHMKKHSSEFGEYECELCHLRFPLKQYLYRHKLTSHKRKYYCKDCPYVCYCTAQAKTHADFHKGKKYQCNLCTEEFSMPNSLLMHKRRKHLLQSVCAHCGETFVTQRGLSFHIVRLHRQAKNEKLGPECKECDVHFSSETAWKRHLVVSSKHNVSNGCKACGESFTNAEDLKTHTRVHAQKLAYGADNVKLPAVCKFCNKWLETHSEYKEHVTSQHPMSDDAKRLVAADETSFVCEVCGKKFKQRSFLNYHQRVHTGERPFKCNVCGKAFQSSSALNVHKTVHDRKRSYKCELCGKVVRSRNGLSKHVKGHINVRPHKCNLCDKAYLHQCELRQHIKYIHDKVPWPKKKPKRTRDQAFEHDI